MRTEGVYNKDEIGLYKWTKNKGLGSTQAGPLADRRAAPVCNAFGCGWSPPPRRASSSNSSPVLFLDLVSAAVGPLPATFVRFRSAYPLHPASNFRAGKKNGEAERRDDEHLMCVLVGGSRMNRCVRISYQSSFQV